MSDSRRRTIDLALLGGLCVLLFFFRLGSFGLLGADEPRYAQVAHEMLRAGDWVTPVLYGHTWLEKPIAYYWGAMVSFKFWKLALAWHIDYSLDAAARVPSAIVASLLVFCVYFVMGRLRAAARLDAALMVASSALFLGMARAASTDMMLSAPFGIAMLCWYAFEADAAEGREVSRWWLVGSYAALGVAALAKGPIAPFLAVVILGAYSLLRRDAGVLRRALWIPGLLAFFAVAAPWYLLVQHRTPDFFRVFILEHNLGRFGSNLFRHKQPFWYYLPVVLIGTAPWTFFVLAAFVAGVRAWWADRKRAATEQDGLILFLLLWAVIPIAFFSVSQSKLPAYILPAIPPLLILAAEWVQTQAEASDRVPFWLAGAHAVLLSALAAVLLMTPSLVLKVQAAPRAMMIGGFLGSIVFVGVILALLIRGWSMVRFATLLPVVLYISFILRVLAPSIDMTQSARPVVELMGDAAIEQVATFGVKRELSYGIAWYLGRTPIAYDGLEVSPHEFELPPTVPDYPHLVVVREGMREQLRARVPGREIALIGFLRAQHIEIYRVAAAH